jgi:hypothetical protein
MITGRAHRAANVFTSLLVSLLGVPVLAQQPTSDSAPSAASSIESLRLSSASTKQLRDSLALGGYLDSAFVAQHPRACTESQSAQIRIRRLSLPHPSTPDGWMQFEVAERRRASGATDLPMISVRRGLGDGPQLEGAVVLGAFLRVERIENNTDRSSAFELFPVDDPLTDDLRDLAARVLALPCSRLE